MKGYAWYVCLFILIVLIPVFIRYTKEQSAVCIRYDDVMVKVVGVEHHPPHLTMIRVGNSTVPVNHPSKYITLVSYDGYQFELNDEDIYEKYKNRIGEYVNARLETKFYKNNKIKYEIVRIY